MGARRLGANVSDGRREVITKEGNQIANQAVVSFHLLSLTLWYGRGSSDAALLAAGSVVEAAMRVMDGSFQSAVCVVRPPGIGLCPLLTGLTAIAKQSTQFIYVCCLSASSELP